jgi:hypothetical protein
MQTNGEVEERHTTRSLTRRRDRSDLAVVPKLEEVSITAERRWKVFGNEVERFLGRIQRTRGNIYCAQNYQHLF